MTSPERVAGDRLARLAVACAIAGLAALLIYLLNGFGPVSMAIGFFVGWPLLVLALALYVAMVIRDLRAGRYL